MLRIYKKGLESKEEQFKNIIRFELEIKKENAENAIKELQTKEVGKVIKGVLTNYIRIVKPSLDKNKSRWETARYWERFIGEVEKIRLSNGVLEKTLEQKIEWFTKQNAPSMALIHVGENELLNKILKDGFKRLKAKDLSILDTYLKSKPKTK